MISNYIKLDAFKPNGLKTVVLNTNFAGRTPNQQYLVSSSLNSNNIDKENFKT